MLAAPGLASLAAVIAITAALAAGIRRGVAGAGGVDVLNHVALDLEQPRIRNLQRAARLIAAFGLTVTAAVRVPVSGVGAGRRSGESGRMRLSPASL